MVRNQLRQGNIPLGNVESDNLKVHIERTWTMEHTKQKARMRIVIKIQRNSITKEIFEELWKTNQIIET